MAAFAIELIIVHKNVQYGFYTLLSCHHSNHGAACLFSSAIKLLMTVAIAIFFIECIETLFDKAKFCSTAQFKYMHTNQCCCTHIHTVAVSTTLRYFLNRFNIDKE